MAIRSITQPGGRYRIEIEYTDLTHATIWGTGVFEATAPWGIYQRVYDAGVGQTVSWDTYDQGGDPGESINDARNILVRRQLGSRGGVPLVTDVLWAMNRFHITQELATRLMGGEADQPSLPDTTGINWRDINVEGEDRDYANPNL